MANLYYVKNCGCDDITTGLVEISDEDFPKFKQFIENLNKNSTYGCMPTIGVYAVDWDMFHEKTEEDDDSWDYLYFGDRVFVPNDSTTYWLYKDKIERVI